LEVRLEDRNRPAAGLLSERDDAENPVGITVWATGEEQLIVRAVRAAVLTELQRPNVIDLDGVATGVTKRPEKPARVRIESVHAASGDVVADQNGVTHGAEVGRGLSNAPGRVQRSMERVVAKQGAIGRKNVHKPALRLVQGSKRHPNLSVDRLNAVGGEILRNVWIAERFHKRKRAIERIGGIPEPKRAVASPAEGSSRVQFIHKHDHAFTFVNIEYEHGIIVSGAPIIRNLQ
jgi:hypothetical protein